MIVYSEISVISTEWLNNRVHYVKIDTNLWQVKYPTTYWNVLKIQKLPPAVVLNGRFIN